MFKKINAFVRTIKIIYKLGERGIVLDKKTNPYVRITIKSIVSMVAKTELSDEEIIALIKETYDALDKKEKEGILNGAAEAIEKWAKEL